MQRQRHHHQLQQQTTDKAAAAAASTAFCNNKWQHTYTHTVARPGVNNTHTHAQADAQIHRYTGTQIREPLPKERKISLTRHTGSSRNSSKSSSSNMEARQQLAGPEASGSSDNLINSHWIISFCNLEARQHQHPIIQIHLHLQLQLQLQLQIQIQTQSFQSLWYRSGDRKSGTASFGRALWVRKSKREMP